MYSIPDEDLSSSGPPPEAFSLSDTFIPHDAPCFLFLGPTSGKSSIIDRLINNNFSPTLLKTDTPSLYISKIETLSYTGIVSIVDTPDSDSVHAEKIVNQCLSLALQYDTQTHDPRLPDFDTPSSNPVPTSPTSSKIPESGIIDETSRLLPKRPSFPFSLCFIIVVDINNPIHIENVRQLISLLHRTQGFSDPEELSATPPSINGEGPIAYATYPCPIVIFSNKSDVLPLNRTNPTDGDNEESINPTIPALKDIASKLPHVYHMQGSAKTNDNIDNLFEIAMKMILEHNYSTSHINQDGIMESSIFRSIFCPCFPSNYQYRPVDELETDSSCSIL